MKMPVEAISSRKWKPLVTNTVLLGFQSPLHSFHSLYVENAFMEMGIHSGHLSESRS